MAMWLKRSPRSSRTSTGRHPVRETRHSVLCANCLWIFTSVGWYCVAAQAPAPAQPAQPAPQPHEGVVPHNPRALIPNYGAPNYGARGSYPWTKGSFVGEFCDCFIDNTDLEGGQSAPALMDLAKYVGDAMDDRVQTPLLRENARWQHAP